MDDEYSQGINSFGVMTVSKYMVLFMAVYQNMPFVSVGSGNGKIEHVVQKEFDSFIKELKNVFLNATCSAMILIDPKPRS